MGGRLHSGYTLYSWVRLHRGYTLCTIQLGQTTQGLYTIHYTGRIDYIGTLHYTLYRQGRLHRDYILYTIQVGQTTQGLYTIHYTLHRQGRLHRDFTLYTTFRVEYILHRGYTLYTIQVGQTLGLYTILYVQSRIILHRGYTLYIHFTACVDYFIVKIVFKYVNLCNLVLSNAHII